MTNHYPSPGERGEVRESLRAGRRRWLAEMGRHWSCVLYGEEHEDTREWRKRCRLLQVH